MKEIVRIFKAGLAMLIDEPRDKDITIEDLVAFITLHAYGQATRRQLLANFFLNQPLTDKDG